MVLAETKLTTYEWTLLSEEHFDVSVYFSGSTYLDFESFDVVHRDHLDLAGAVWGRAGNQQQVTVCPKHVVSLEPPPACRVVGDVAAVRTLHQYVALVVCAQCGGRSE